MSHPPHSPYRQTVYYQPGGAGPGPEDERRKPPGSILVLVAGGAGVVCFFLGLILGAMVGAPALGQNAAAAPTVTVTEFAGPAEDPSAQDQPPADQSGGQYPADQAPVQDQPAQQPAQRQPAEQQPVQRQPAQQQPDAGSPATGTIRGEGIFLVGKDVQAGTYASAGPASGSPACYWARLKGVSGQASDIIANGYQKGPQTITIDPADKAFQSMGCQDWSLR
ncbi:hypothetical protein [Bailinhaonella thermotolerans]|uniref:Uncharacterized protein n=1 Tax=Bailinhaonella thermotolerans TaxID=1070861 RepID=A0A3A4B0R6_9ACTN|nr:hypothetical protein [Bailinhaonella thermotolerans]RJL31617.1 hypothetical protein D5H75_18020 [Bailinhaonella thermotolerans]